MKIKDLKGRECNWNLAGYVPKGDDTRPRSQLHLRARILLKAIFPADQRLEEVKLPKSRMRLDFFLPQQMIAVEVQGQQHGTYIPFFHKTRLNFMAALRRDNEKLEWCENNDITIVELPHDESDDQWKERIVKAHTGADC